MRIIAGTARSLPLKSVPGMETRPTTDRIKETLFNMLQEEIPGCLFLDLFAGSGQIGLEALSRGARRAVFVDSGKSAAACIEENIRFTKFGEQARLITADAMSALRMLEGEGPFDIIFMDPPYQRGMEREVLAYLSDSTLVGADTLIIVEAARDTGFEYLDEYSLDVVRLKTYKTNEHAFIRKR